MMEINMYQSHSKKASVVVLNKFKKILIIKNKYW